MHPADGSRIATVASPEKLKAAMRRWATGVAVVTIRSGCEVRGVTVNSFTSVSLDPPLILVCLNRWVRTHYLLLAAQHFCVNLLSEEQRPLSERFAGRRPVDDFSDISQHQTANGAPVLAASLAWLDCRLIDTHAAGDHTIFIGLVLEAHTGGGGGPLLHHQGNYYTLIQDRAPSRNDDSSNSGR